VPSVLLVWPELQTHAVVEGSQRALVTHSVGTRAVCLLFLPPDCGVVAAGVVVDIDVVVTGVVYDVVGVIVVDVVNDVVGAIGVDVVDVVGRFVVPVPVVVDEAVVVGVQVSPNSKSEEYNHLLTCM